jgi:hypothetical protein
MVFSTLPEAPFEEALFEAPFVAVVAVDEEELYFYLPPVVGLPEAAALPVPEDPLPPAEDPPPLPLPQPASINASTSVRAPTRSVPFSGVVIILSLHPLG